eukprot:c31761_g1_i1.p1 GENE.c31761_g1_i1~~c31761_g1_i1.p1  ORF type:complete len:164 (+),score=63.14 c31761_g1_i1:40-531(+)
MSDSDSSDSLYFLVGITLCLLSAFSSVIGVNLQKKAHNKRASIVVIGDEKKKSLLRDPLWWFGLSLVVLGALLDFASMGFAPQTVVAAFGAATLVINTWTAPFFLKETLTKKAFGATLMISCGAILVVVNASNHSSELSLNQVYARFSSQDFTIYIIGVMWSR